ncbi:helix-turn-helix domain-containing protein, partial [Corynebacterium phoceense]
MSKHYAGARIHALRKQHGLTQVAMAKSLGLSTSYLNQLENDQRPLTVTVLMQLSQRFNVDPSYFSTEKDLH